MKHTPIELESFALDELGRVILSDHQLEQIECRATIATAGANSFTCPGSNSGCTNSGTCSGSWNSFCSNPACYNATNTYSCS